MFVLLVKPVRMSRKERGWKGNQRQSQRKKKAFIEEIEKHVVCRLVLIRQQLTHEKKNNSDNKKQTRKCFLTHTLSSKLSAFISSFSFG